MLYRAPHLAHLEAQDLLHLRANLFALWRMSPQRTRAVVPWVPLRIRQTVSCLGRTFSPRDAWLRTRQIRLGASSRGTEYPRHALREEPWAQWSPCSFE